MPDMEGLNKHQAVVESAKNLFRSLGKILKGEAVIIPVRLDSYNDRVAPNIDHGFGETGPDVVDDALYRAPMNVGDLMEMAEHYDIPFRNIVGPRREQWTAPFTDVNEEIAGSEELATSS